MRDCDVLIAGGGPTGGCLALALRGSGLRVAVLDAGPRGTAGEDPRPLALAHGTRLVLERLGLWTALQPVTPIAKIHVSQRGGFGRVVLDAAAAGLPALGYVVDYTRLASLVARSLEGAGCEWLPDAPVTRAGADAGAALVDFQVAGTPQRCRARVLVIADGGTRLDGGARRVVDYGQTAVTARVAAAVAHSNVAYERFTPEGPLALLPDGERLALVWTTSPGRARQLTAAPPDAFAAELERAFGGRLGRFTGVERRDAFALALRVAGQPLAARAVRIGNAAQTLHPVAGQGLNLGLRDAWELAAELRRCAREAVGSPASLARYAARRRADRAGGIAFTHGLVNIFAGDFAPLRCARGLGLAALAAVPPARDFLVQRMSFGARAGTFGPASRHGL